MVNEGKIVRELGRELCVEAAPPGVWLGIERRLAEGSQGRRQTTHPAQLGWRWAFASAVGACVLFLLFQRKPEVDLASYLQPVESASAASGTSAVAQAPPHFEATRSTSPAIPGFEVTAQREAHVGGATVRQVVFSAADTAFALFIGPPKVRFGTGATRWTDGEVAGVSCKRLDTHAVRAAKFSCLEQTCLLICKTCSDRALGALMDGARQLH